MSGSTSSIDLPHADAGGKARYPVLVLEGVEKSYGSTIAVSDFSLAVNEGEFVTLLGASGSGKSTVLMMIAGFTDPTKGEIKIRGQSIVDQPPHKRKIGIVFQNYALFPHLTVYENVAFSLRNARWSRTAIEDRVAELLNTVRLDDLRYRLPAQLSGGQQQRVAIARALAIKPEILLFDEPLGALDKNLRQHMVLELQQLHKKLGTTMIYVTHDQEEALVMSDRIAVLDSGKLVAVEAPQKLYDDPGSVFVAEFLGHSNILSVGGRKVSVRPERISLGDVPAGWVVTTATILQVTFLGHQLRYQARLADGATVIVSVQRGNGVRLHDVGSTVTLGWHPDDARGV